MKITTLSSYKQLKVGDLVGKTAVIVDMFCANTSMIAALYYGCDRVIPVASLEEAGNARKGVLGDILLSGSYDNEKIPDFDMGNSPSCFTKEVVNSKIIIHYSTNATKAINAAVEASSLFIGALCNAGTIAKKLEKEQEITIVCAGGKGGHMCMEDLFAAGAMIDRVLSLVSDAEIDDSSLLAQRMYIAFQNKAKEILKGSTQYETLVKMGMEKEIAYCLKEDIFNIAPFYSEGVLRL